MPEYPHPPVHFLEAPLLGDQQDLRTFLHRLDAALNSWNGRPGNSKTIPLYSIIHPFCDPNSPFLHRFACLNWDPKRGAIGQHPWHHLASFSVFVSSTVDPLSLDLVWIELDKLIYLHQIILFCKIKRYGHVSRPSVGLTEEKRTKKRKRKKILLGDLGHHESPSYKIMEKTSAGSPRHLLSK